MFSDPCVVRAAGSETPLRIAARYGVGPILFEFTIYGNPYAYPGGPDQTSRT
eukprot:SAG22_NODE_2229_length_2812_cov_4.603022_2_plen_52_part_00